MASGPSTTTKSRPPAITIWQKLDFLPAILQLLIETLGTALLAPFRGQHAPKTFKRHVMLKVMRRGVERFSPVQIQWVSGTTSSHYAAWTKAKNITPQSVPLSKAQTSAFWIGDPSAETVVLYFHGGGWAVPAGDGHFNFLSHLSTTAATAGKSLAFLLVQYDLAPAKQYPHQLKQCVELLRYAVTDLRKPPAQLMLGGDSAGGSMVAGVLLHLLRPHPEIEPVKLAQPLKAAFAASPWVDFDMSSPRFRGSDNFDAASVKTLKTWAHNYVGTSTVDAWREPAKAKAEDWRRLDTVVDDMLFTIAREEVMADDVRQLAASMEKSYSKLTLFAAAEDFHAEPVLGSNAGFGMGDAAKAIEAWVVEKC